MVGSSIATARIVKSNPSMNDQAKRNWQSVSELHPPKAAMDSATAITWQALPSPYFCLWPWPLLWGLGVHR